MDTSEIYIKMCDCEEIQKMSPSMDDTEEFWISHDGKRVTKITWLPRQDQLQEMVVKNESAKWASLEERFHHFIYDPTTYYVREEKYLTSMEQFWLAFVMKEKFNKVWDGAEWVNLTE